MFYQEDVKVLHPGMQAFPAAAEVFSEQQPWLSQHFLPLISIDLGLLRPELAGTVVHMLNPLEPSEGYIGDGTEAHHNDYTAPNWLSFRLDEHNRYHFLGREGYFQAAALHGGVFDDADAVQHREEMHSSYAQAKAYYQAEGRLGVDYGYGETVIQSYLDSLGGDIWYGNWTVHPPIAPAFSMHIEENNNDNLPDDGICITHQGQAFLYVAEVSGYNWCAHGADAILLFYEPQSRTVLFTYEWT